MLSYHCEVIDCTDYIFPPLINQIVNSHFYFLANFLFMRNVSIIATLYEPYATVRVHAYVRHVNITVVFLSITS